MKHVGTADNKEGRNTTWDVGKHLSRNVQASNDSSEPIKTTGEMAAPCWEQYI